MPPRTRRAPVWSDGKVLDLISVWGEEAVQSHLRSSHRNYDTFGQISREMMQRGHDRDALQCRIKVKELQNAYRKAREANSRSDAAPATCHFYKELDVILGGRPHLHSKDHHGHFRGQFNKAEQEEEEQQRSRSKGA
ncbi:Zinc finger and SCAN domain-containing protein 20 [Chelonia mydas]|uniref:Zinc finger and SCAN domain-containing protein 20 n=1 Tax=Chelonia mydas TaxID=8469 RepID=M7B0T5_CHEMY|nr:Zinc finger and SCAN domain-containing protein 20 [Chelonia mydas]